MRSRSATVASDERGPVGPVHQRPRGGRSSLLIARVSGPMPAAANSPEPGNARPLRAGPRFAQEPAQGVGQVVIGAPEDSRAREPTCIVDANEEARHGAHAQDPNRHSFQSGVSSRDLQDRLLDPLPVRLWCRVLDHRRHTPPQSWHDALNLERAEASWLEPSCAACAQAARQADWPCLPLEVDLPRSLA